MSVVSFALAVVFIISGDGDLRLKLTKMEPRIKQTCNQDQVQKSIQQCDWASQNIWVNFVHYNSYHVVKSVVTEQKQILLTCSSSGGAWDFFDHKSGAWFKKGLEPLV